jgi:hypothetical protein
MPQEFQAIMTIETDKELKSTGLTLESLGPGPLPLSEFFQERIVLMSYSQMVGFLERIIKALSDHEDDHNFCESNEQALVEARELLARLTK